MFCSYLPWSSKWFCSDKDALERKENVKEKLTKMAVNRNNTIDIIIPQFEQLPLKRECTFNQPHVPVSIHPQIRRKALGFVSDYPCDYSPSLVNPNVKKPSLIMEQPVSFMPFSDPSLIESADKPLLEFMLYYDFKKCELTVTLIQATNLPAKHESGTSNPFVTLFLLPHKEDIHRSKTHYKTLNPTFNESFTFEGIQYSEVMERTLVLHVFDEEKISKNDNIGTIVMTLRKTELHGARVAAVLNEESGIIKTTTNGDIQITLQYNPIMNIISGILIKATGLKRMDITGLSDPHVDIKVYYKNVKKFSWKSTTKKKTLNPVYNEIFQIDLTDMDINSIYMKLVMKDKDLIFQDTFMGMVEFGKHVEHSTGNKHWMDMLATPHTGITRWHTLMNKEEYNISTSGMLRRL